MTLRPWLKNGRKIMDGQGRPVLCDRCPCGGVSGCVSAVDAEVQRLLALVDESTQQHIWLLQNTFTTDYQCAEWSYDAELETWTLVHPATGHLLVALPRGSIVTDTTGYGHGLLTYAKTLQNIQTGGMLTVGCECRISDHECRHGMVSLEGYDVAGELPVWSPEDPTSITPSDGCRVDSCNLLKLKLVTAQRWHGGTLMGEGYYDWLTTPQVWQSNNYHYQPFIMAVKWEVAAEPVEPPSEPDPPTYNITFIDCECSTITTHTLQDGETCLEYAGICDTEDPCIDMMLLHNKAVENGWTWHGEGVLVHLAKCTVNGSVVAYGDWYALREQSWYQGDYSESVAYSKKMCCAETATGYWVMSCGCGTPAFYTKDDPIEAYWLYLDLEGVCACPWEDGRYPDRELILTYPDVFGIDDVVWGNDNKFNYTYTSTWYDMDTGQTVTSSYSGCGVCGYTYEPVQGTGGRTMYIDYRAMCFTGKALDQAGNVKTWLRVIYPYGSQGAPYRGNVRQYFTPPTGYYLSSGGNNSIYDTVSFTGTHYTPFTNDMDIGYTVTYSNGQPSVSNYGLSFTGMHYIWSHGGWSMDMWVNGCQPSEVCDQSLTDPDEAASLAGCNGMAPTPCINVDTTSSHLHLAAAVLSPDFTVVDHPCNVREVRVTPDEPDGWSYSYYCYTPRWITIGANAGTYPTQYGTGCAWLMLNIHYVCTNEGFIVKGLNGYRETYTLPGVGNYPQYADCGQWSGYDPEEIPYWDDSTISCPADEDMHFCIEGFEVPVDEDEGESE
jgi:hypothetical protein